MSKNKRNASFGQPVYVDICSRKYRVLYLQEKRFATCDTAIKSLSPSNGLHIHSLLLVAINKSLFRYMSTRVINSVIWVELGVN